MWEEYVEPTYIENDLMKTPCASCGINKVFHLGDYCRTCALDPDLTASEHTYIILSPATLNLAAEQSQLALPYLRIKMERAFEQFLHYVIYFGPNGWDELLISDKFYIPHVMKYLFRNLEEG